MHSGEELETLSVTPTKIEATLVATDGTERNAEIGPDLHLHINNTGNRVNNRRGLPVSAIAAGGPERILRVAQRKFDLRPADFERLELDAPSGASPGGWAASWTQPTDDDGVVATLQGTDVRRPFTPAKDSQ